MAGFPCGRAANRPRYRDQVACDYDHGRARFSPQFDLAAAARGDSASRSTVSPVSIPSSAAVAPRSQGDGSTPSIGHRGRKKACQPLLRSAPTSITARLSAHFGLEVRGGLAHDCGASSRSLPHRMQRTVAASKEAHQSGDLGRRGPRAPDPRGLDPHGSLPQPPWPARPWIAACPRAPAFSPLTFQHHAPRPPRAIATRGHRLDRCHGTWRERTAHRVGCGGACRSG